MVVWVESQDSDREIELDNKATSPNISNMPTNVKSVAKIVFKNRYIFGISKVCTKQLTKQHLVIHDSSNMPPTVWVLTSISKIP